MIFASDLLSSDGVAHQATQEKKPRPRGRELSERTVRNRAREAEEIKACLNCKHRECLQMCPEIIAIRKKYRRKKQ